MTRRVGSSLTGGGLDTLASAALGARPQVNAELRASTAPSVRPLQPGRCTLPLGSPPSTPIPRGDRPAPGAIPAADPGFFKAPGANFAPSPAVPSPPRESQRAELTRAALFRPSALSARHEPVIVEALPELSRGRWALLGFVTSALLTALVTGFVGRVEVTSIAPGALIVRGGPRPALARASGRVTLLQVRPGEQVAAGQQIARIDATELRAREGRNEEQLRVVTQNAARITRSRTALRKSSLQALVRKRALLAQRATLKRSIVAQRKERVASMDLLAREGAASAADALATRETLRAAQEELLFIQQQLAEVDLELGDRTREYEAEQEALARQVQEANAELAEAHSMVELSSVEAPVAGKLESLLVTTGQVVQSGTALARIVPDGMVTSLVVFAPVKDAAFLHNGLDASVEFASLPVSEFGKAKAHVTRVSNDVATAAEVSEILGVPADQAVVRVELELVPGPALERVRSHLRSGERAIARLNTRKKRIITLLFDFLRRWYPT